MWTTVITEALEHLPWLMGPKKPDDSAHAGRDDRVVMGARLDRGAGQEKGIRLEKDETLDSNGSPGDPKLMDAAAQRALVEELEREFANLPEEVQKEVAGDLMVAKNALSRGEKIPSMTLSHLAQVKQEQDTRNALKLLAASAHIPAGLGVCGGESVCRSGRIAHGLDHLGATGAAAGRSATLVFAA